MRRHPIRWRRLAALACGALALSACGDTTPPSSKMLAVIGAFPAEMAAVLDRATVEETKTIDGHTFRIGTLGGRKVVIAMTGIGLINAGETTRLLLDNFDVAGVVVSAVAGSPLLVGDVTVPAAWLLDDGSRYPADSGWLEIAKKIAQDKDVLLDHCARIPEGGPITTVPAGTEVCFPYAPRVVVGGYGTSSDPVPGQRVRCAGSTDVLACDTEDPKPFSGVSVGDEAPAALVVVDPDTQTAYDEETAAMAREVTARGIHFIAFRASSDGGPDPLNLSGFIEFYGYYRLAAHNAAAAAEAFVAHVR
jgi:nucleoside phosphorylase